MPSPNQVPFNREQLATWEEARETALVLSQGPIVVGGGVKNETLVQETSGIYVPFWVGGPGGFSEPHFTDPDSGKKYFFLHYRFNNGMEGMNVGLIRSKFGRYPMSPLYVLMTLAAEANQAH